MHRGWLNTGLNKVEGKDGLVAKPRAKDWGIRFTFWDRSSKDHDSHKTEISCLPTLILSAWIFQGIMVNNKQLRPYSQVCCYSQWLHYSNLNIERYLILLTTHPTFIFHLFNLIKTCCFLSPSGTAHLKGYLLTSLYPYSMKI